MRRVDVDKSFYGVYHDAIQVGRDWLIYSHINGVPRDIEYAPTRKLAVGRVYELDGRARTSISVARRIGATA